MLTNAADPDELTTPRLVIVNLVSGACWPVPATELVNPALDVRLTFNTARCLL